MRGLIVVLVVLAAVAGGVTWLLWPRGAGTKETDRQARTIAEAISYPRQADAMGYARALIAVNHIGAQVMEATDIQHTDLQKPMVHLVMRINYQACRKGDLLMCEQVPATVCYGVDLNYYQPLSSPWVVDCPSNAPVIPPPLPRTDIPAGTVDSLQSILAALPASPTEAQVTAALAGLPKPVVDPKTGLAGIPPTVRSSIHGTDVGVSVLGGDHDCLLGLRENGKAKAWYPPRVQTQPGEYGCGPDVAFSLAHTPPPH
ncbi:hypothetical protein [Kutzneria chonburiensis]|uniref:Uncharacterized protein n=1 Tax=Kutzneria chonburiensis TaxID=1483604 RepID=A0ABV6MIG4_9PSEU|nr:hypothetical protein [Kutzneria chonburiensis]